MSYYPPYDPARASYYGPPGYPPAGYPPHPPPPHSPTDAPPARPHTAAPFPASSQYAPPPGAHYYGVPPPVAGGPPPTPGGGHPSPAEYPPMPPAPPPVAAPPAPGPSAGPAPFDDMSPEQLQGMIDQLNRLKVGKTASPAPAPAVPVAPAPPAPGSPPPRIDTSMGMPPPSHGVPHSARGPPPMSYGYPPYGYYGRPGPASHSGEVSPPPPAPAPPQGRGHPGYPPPKSKTPALGPMPGAFASDTPAPPPAPAPPPPSKTPALAPSGRPEPARKVSGQMSEMSFGSSKSHDMAHAWEQWGGPLVEVAPGREPRPKPKLVALFRGIAAYMVTLLEPTHSCVVTLGKLIQFYNTFAVGEGEATDWQRFFNLRSPKVLSELFCALNVEHHLVPTKPNQTPTLPGLTPRGFEVWMFTQLMTAPHREWHRISKILDQWTIFDQGAEMPRMIPRECFPQTEDRAIYQGWWQAVRDDYPEETPESDDERKVPLGLPEPEKPRRRAYSVRGDGPSDTPPEDSGSKDPPSPAPPSLIRKRTSRPYSTTNVVPDPQDFLTSEEKDNSPVDRFRSPYSPAPPAPPPWREDPRREEVNPRPTLGEEPPRPPTRSRSVKPKGGSTKDSTSRHAAKRGRSVRRRRDDSPDRYSDDEYDGYGRKYEGDGLYEDPSPPTRATTPHHSTHHPREPSRGPPAPRKVEKDIRDYTYQEQYEKDYVVPPTVPAATRRTHRASDAHLHHAARKSGQWRYA